MREDLAADGRRSDHNDIVKGLDVIEKLIVVVAIVGADRAGTFSLIHAAESRHKNVHACA